MSKTFFDMGSRNTLSKEWDLFFEWPYRSTPPPVWPPWLTGPEHYLDTVPRKREMEWDRNGDKRT